MNDLKSKMQRGGSSNFLSGPHQQIDSTHQQITLGLGDFDFYYQKGDHITSKISVNWTFCD